MNVKGYAILKLLFPLLWQVVHRPDVTIYAFINVHMDISRIFYSDKINHEGRGLS